jgi:hypothetical protein
MPGSDPRKGGRPGRGAPAPEPGSGPKFFLAVYQSGLRGSRIYRVYPGADDLLFLCAGPIVVFMDVETARKVDPTHWAIKAASALGTGLVAAAGGLLVLAVVLLRLLLPTARNDPTQTANLLALLGVVAACTLVFLVVALGASVRKLTKRVEQLDSLKEDQLHKEVARDSWNFRVTAGDVSDVRIDPLEQRGVLGASKDRKAARLSFRHASTGTWKLNLVRPRDTRAAVRAFCHLLGRNKVAVNVSVEGD